MSRRGGGRTRKILVPVDGSRPSKHAVRFAAHLSRLVDAGVTALRVINIPRFAHWIATHQRLEKELEEEAARILQDAREIARQYGVEIETEVRRGFPYEEIIKIARDDTSIILVVLGASGRERTSRQLLGRVAEEVVREVCRSLPCPVVVVPGTDEMIHERLGI